MSAHPLSWRVLPRRIRRARTCRRARRRRECVRPSRPSRAAQWDPPDRPRLRSRDCYCSVWCLRRARRWCLGSWISVRPQRWQARIASLQGSRSEGGQVCVCGAVFCAVSRLPFPYPTAALPQNTSSQSAPCQRRSRFLPTASPSSGARRCDALGCPRREQAGCERYSFCPPQCSLRLHRSFHRQPATQTAAQGARL